MPELTIDGQRIEVEEGTTVLEAAEQLGIDIPVFCYHPGLPPDGNCRMCIVDQEEAPILPPSCITECQDDMVIHTDNEDVKEAREGVLEFLLLNHPLDCPICDKSGECMLQDHYFDFSAERSRMVEPKVKKRKVVDVGPEIVLDTERCILCTRCIRFVENISEEPSLGIVNKGDRAELTTFPGQELDDPYSLNTVDICPVGALTSKKFRFRERVWFLDETSSVCPNCSRGCNIQIDHKDGEIQRFMPRHNPHVNDYWLCDEGRQCFDWVNDDNRVEQPLRSKDGTFDPISWDDVEGDLYPKLRKISEQDQPAAGLLSTRLSNEENYQLVQFFDAFYSTDQLSFPGGQKGWLQELTEDDILRKADKNPNRSGCELLKDHYDLPDFDQFLSSFDESPELLIISDPMPFNHIDNDEQEETFRALLDETPLVVYLATHENLEPGLADWVLPGRTWAEKEGTFTNVNDRVQLFEQGLHGPHESKSQLSILSEMARGIGSQKDPLLDDSAESIFQRWSSEIIDQDWDYHTLGDHGRTTDGEEDPDPTPDVTVLEDVEEDQETEPVEEGG